MKPSSMGGGVAKPNVSHCVSENEVHYNPIETRLIVKYNVTNASELTKLYNYYSGGATAALMFDKVEVDDAEVSLADLDTASGKTQLSVGEHTVKYTLKDSTSIVRLAFFSCSGLTSVTIPNSMTSIGEGAFSLCTGLTSVTIGNSVTFIGEGAFYNCRSLTYVHITDLVAWCRIYFSGYESNPLYYAHYLYTNGEETNDLVIPNSVTGIGNYAFSRCYGLTSVTIPNSVSTIGGAAFGGCSSLSSINIPDSVTSIGDDAFCGTNLDEAIKAKITAINEYGICAPGEVL